MRPDLPEADTDFPLEAARAAEGAAPEREMPPIGYESAMPALVRAAAEA